jgi:hypothetical protein
MRRSGTNTLAAAGRNLQPLTDGDVPLLHKACRHRASTLDGVNAFDGHEKRLVDGANGLRDVRVESVEQLGDAPDVSLIAGMLQRPRLPLQVAR